MVIYIWIGNKKQQYSFVSRVWLWDIREYLFIYRYNKYNAIELSENLLTWHFWNKCNITMKIWMTFTFDLLRSSLDLVFNGIFSRNSLCIYRYTYFNTRLVIKAFIYEGIYNWLKIQTWECSWLFFMSNL